MLFNRKSLNAATETVHHAGAGATAPAATQNRGKRDKRITEIPVKQMSSHANYKPTGFWSGMFDIAVWLRLPQGSAYPLQLALRYTDQSGEHTVLVDMCQPGSFKSALLNGSVQIDVSGRVKDMGLYLLGLPSDLYLGLEEWHLVPQIKQKKRA